jgi:hypothetical protein
VVQVVVLVDLKYYVTTILGRAIVLKENTLNILDVTIKLGIHIIYIAKLFKFFTDVILVLRKYVEIAETNYIIIL